MIYNVTLCRQLIFEDAIEAESEEEAVEIAMERNGYDCLPVYDSLGDQSYFAHIDIFRLNHKMYCNQ